VCDLFVLKSSLERSPKLKDSVEDPFSSKRLGWEAFTLGYMSECKVRSLHRGM
jgi:hypothetical protein